MKPTTYVIAFATELATSMQFCKAYLNSAFMLWLVHSRWNTTSIVNNFTTAIFLQKHLYVITIASKCFINTVVNNFCHQMVKSSFISASNVHSRSLSYWI